MSDAGGQADRVKPRFRGVSHQYGFFLSLGAGALLVGSATAPGAAQGALIFSASLSGLLGTSALYHRVDWTPARRAFMRRMDHAMIYVLIAGTFTPVVLRALEPNEGRPWLHLPWGLAGLCALLRIVWLSAPKWITAVLAVALGWLPIGTLPRVVASIGWPPVALIALGGVAYTVGAVVYALKRPYPIPAVFGYHEIFHALVLVGAGLHYAAIALWVT